MAVANAPVNQKSVAPYVAVQGFYANEEATRDKAIEWAYSNPKAIDYFAEFAKAPRDIAKQAVDDFFPKEALQIGEIRELDMTLKDALQYKYITTAVTAKDVEGMIDILHKPR